MKRLCLAAAILILFITPAGADIVVTIPTEAISNTSSTASATITAELNGSYQVAGYGIKVVLTGRDGATGLTFKTPTSASSSAASSNYLFNVAVDPETGLSPTPNAGYHASNSDSLNVFGQDWVTTDTGYGTVADTTCGLVKLNLNVAPGTQGVFDLTFVPEFTGLNDPVGLTFPDQTLVNGVITVVPEPMTLCLFVPGVLWLVSSARKRLKARPI